jgi:tetratricopeptide (TPR) repeat protein
MQLVRRAVDAAPPLSVLTDTLPPWPGSDDEFSRDSGGLGLWSRLIVLQWRLGDTTAARQNAEVFCRWGSRRADYDHPCKWLASDLEKIGEKQFARHLLETAIEGLEGQARRDGFSRQIAGRLAEFDTSAAIRLFTEGVSDSAGDRRLAMEAADMRDWRVGWSLLGHIHESRNRELFFNNFAFDRAYSGDWVPALAATDSLPESHDTKPILLAMVAEAQQRAGETVRAEESIDAVLDHFLPGKEEVYDSGRVLESVGRTLVRLGRVERAESLLVRAPDWVKRSVLIEIAASLARAGLPDSALGVLRSARILKPRVAEQIDDGLVNWITAVAESGDTELAVRASAEIQEASNRGWAYNRTAQAHARRGRIEDANRTIGLITDSPRGLAQAMVALATAEANGGRLDEALRTVDRIPSALERQCGDPPEHSPQNGSEKDPCPPPELAQNSRRVALYQIAATPVGRLNTDRLVPGLSRMEEATLLSTAAVSLLDQ